MTSLEITLLQSLMRFCSVLGRNRFPSVCCICYKTFRSEQGWVIEHEGKRYSICGDHLPLESPTWGSLYPFQRVGAYHLRDRKRLGLFDPMGLGKTVQALSALKKTDSVVIVCPSSVKAVWKSEIDKWRPDLESTVGKGRKPYEWPDSGNILILNYEILPDDFLVRPGRNQQTTSHQGGAFVLIADEAHYLKNPKAARTKRFMKASHQLVEMDQYVWLLTGTPLVNNPFELRTVLHCAKLDKEFGDFHDFCNIFRARRARYGWKFGNPSDVASKILKKVSLRRNKEEVLPEIPEKRHEIVTVPCGHNLLKELDGISLQWQQWVNEAPQKRRNQLPPIQLMSNIRKSLANSRIDVLHDWCNRFEEEEEPLVIFSAHRGPVIEIGQRQGWASIVGSTGVPQRKKAVDAFGRGELRGLALTIQAGGTGLTLTRSSRLLFCDLPYTPADLAQAEDRIHRIGQNRGVIITYLVANHSVDQRVLQILREKASLINEVVEKSEV